MEMIDDEPVAENECDPELVDESRTIREGGRHYAWCLLRHRWCAVERHQRKKKGDLCDQP